MLKREFRWFVVTVTALLLVSSSLLMATPQDSQSAPDDNAITTAIQAKLFQDPSLKTQDIHVSTQQGVVRLTGTVDTPQQQAAVDRIASMEPGVVKVIDSLSVGQSEPSSGANVEYSAPESVSAPPAASAPAQPSDQYHSFGNSDAQQQQIPPSLVLPAGTLVSVRVSQALSSDHNQVGDGFAAVLEQPVVVDGWVVARRGQTLQGRVSVAKKGGRVKGTSELGLDLTELTLVNGNQVPIHTRLLDASGGPSKGRDVEAVGTTTGIGAVIGAIAGEGEGAGIGAGIGAAAGIAGVLLTRGRPTVIPPETLLTFRLESSANISTIPGQAAFRPVTQQDYAQNTLQQRPNRVYVGPQPYYGPPPVYWGYYGYPGYYYPYSWGWGRGWGMWGPGFYGVYRFHDRDGFRGGREWHGDRGGRRH